MHVFKDYQLLGPVLFKADINESKHLLWKYGGVPAIDQKVWDSWGKRVAIIKFRTNKGRTFVIDHDVFDGNKELINLGFGPQYVVEKLYWQIYPPKTKPF